MQLSDEQIEQFEERGFLFFPGLLDGDEVAYLQKPMAEILSRQGPRWCAKKTTLLLRGWSLEPMFFPNHIAVSHCCRGC